MAAAGQLVGGRFPAAFRHAKPCQNTIIRGHISTWASRTPDKNTEKPHRERRMSRSPTTASPASRATDPVNARPSAQPQRPRPASSSTLPRSSRDTEPEQPQPRRQPHPGQQQPLTQSPTVPRSVPSPTSSTAAAPASAPSSFSQHSSSSVSSNGRPASTATTTTTTTDPPGLSPEVLCCYSLSPEQHRQLGAYLDYMLEVNQSMNLTAVRDKDEAWQRHVVDSLALLPVIERHTGAATSATAAIASVDCSGSGSGRDSRPGDAQSASRGVQVGQDDNRGSSRGSSDSSGEGDDAWARSGAVASSSSGRGGGHSGRGRGGERRLHVVDVGTGAGLPGMVLAVARPGWKVTLLDSLRKRCDFLKEAAARADLSNVEVVWCRAEEGGRQPDLREAYDVAVARAVAETRVLAELCLPFVRVGGLWVAAKGPDPEPEVAAAAGAIRQLGGQQVSLERVESHSAEGQRTALVVAKVGRTPGRFPRQPGLPNKKPL